MSTPRAIILLALRASGVVGLGQKPSDDDTNDAYATLQQIAAQWARKRWLSPHLADLAVPLTGAASYTIGTGGAIAAARPDRIEAAFLRRQPTASYPIDWPMEVIDSREEWNRVQMKSLRGIPQAVFYDSAWPLGVVWVYPVSQLGLGYELHLSVKDGVGGFASLDSDTGLPPEYDAALLYNLAARLRPAYQLPPDPTIAALALDALNTIRRANTQLPTLRLPAGLPGTRGRGGEWTWGLAGVGAAPGFNQAQGFQVGVSPLNGTSIVT